MASPVERQAMRRALELAATPGVPRGPNPRVGCVLLSPDGAEVAAGFHRGAGHPHAEVDALAQAGSRASGSTAVVTLEPCDHQGRTPPCARALVAAGVARVVYAQADPNPVAAGGAATLRARGVEVEGHVLEDQARALNDVWTFAVAAGRPFVTWKTAATMDGRVAAPDGTSRWISSAESRQDAHRLRAEVDAVLVGTGTVWADDPSLTARDAAGTPLPLDRQPLRVAMGRRELPPRARLLDDAAATLHVREHDPVAVLAELVDRDVQHVLLEGGPTVAGAFVAAGLVDRVVQYVAPTLLGAGPASLSGTGVTTLAEGRRLDVRAVDRLGPDVRIVAHPVEEV